MRTEEDPLSISLQFAPPEMSKVVEGGLHIMRVKVDALGVEVKSGLHAVSRGVSDVQNTIEHVGTRIHNVQDQLQKLVRRRLVVRVEEVDAAKLPDDSSAPIATTTDASSAFYCNHFTATSTSDKPPTFKLQRSLSSVTPIWQEYEDHVADLESKYGSA